MPKFMELACVERVNTLLDGLRTGDAYLFARIEPYSLKHTVSEKKLYRQLDQCYKITPAPLPDHLPQSINLPVPPISTLGSSHSTVSSFSSNLVRKRRHSLPTFKRHAINPNLSSTSATTSMSLDSTSFSPESILCKRGRLGQYAKKICFDELAKESGSRKLLFYLIAILNASFPDYDFTDIPPYSFKRGSLEDLTSLLDSPLFSSYNESKASTYGDLWDGLNDACDNKLQESLVYIFEPMLEELDPLHEEGVLCSHLFFLCHFKLRRIVLLKLKIKTALTLVNSMNVEEAAELYDTTNLPSMLLDTDEP